MNVLLVVIIASCQNGVKHFLLFSVFTNNGDEECSYVVPALWSHCCESQHKFLALLFAFPCSPLAMSPLVIPPVHQAFKPSYMWLPLLGTVQSLEATQQTPTPSQLVNFILVILEAAFVDSLLNMPKLLPSICFNELLWRGVCDKTLRVEAGKPVKRFLKPSSGKVVCENSVDHKYISDAEPPQPTTRLVMG